MNYIVDHIPITKNDPKRRPGIKMTAEYLTIHSTANPRSTARNERGWLVNPSNKRTASFHIAVDDKESVECIPLNEVAYHAGNRNGNYKSIGIEICESGNRQKTLQNAIWLTAKMLYERNWGIDRLKRHFDWSGKICPGIMASNNWQGWAEFKQNVANELEKIKSNVAKNAVYTTKESVVLPGAKENAVDFRVEFIQEILPGAKENYTNYGILPSLAIAQAILESNWGRSELAQKSNNLFGIKAGPDWQGESVMHNTKEFVNGKMITVQAPFRAYNTKADSIKDHGKFLRYRKNGNVFRYQKVWESTDYKQATYEVWKAGYATDPNYVKKVVNVIERYNLQQHDIVSWEDRLGKNAINELADKQLLNNRGQWLQRDLTESTPLWLFFEMLNRITKGEN